MTPGVLVPAVVEAALLADPAVGELVQIRPTIGGFSNLTFYADLRSGETVVVKIASREVKREDLRREVRMLARLSDTAIPIVNVRAHINTPDWTITVTDMVPGDLGLNVVQTRDVVDLAGRARVLARLLQVVHQATPQPVKDPDLDCGERLATRHEILIQRTHLAAEVIESNRALIDPLLQRGVALVHGDFGFHNTIWAKAEAVGDPLGIDALLDWEWSGWGNALTDPAWLWWTLQFRQAPKETWDSFVETYGDWAMRGIGWNSANVLTVLRAHMAWILSCTEAGSPAEKEWCNRIVKLESLNPPEL
jgi:aminoglycoside phosphotransferase (APT) family kinase protein